MNRTGLALLLSIAACGGGAAAPDAPPEAAQVAALFASPDQVIRLDLEIEPDDLAFMITQVREQTELPPTQRDYDYVECTVRFQGQAYPHVGVRHKGNTSLINPFEDGRTKLPFKLDFDKFDDEYPETDGRTLLGMDKINLANGFRDPTLLRDIFAVDLLREFGANAPRARPCAVYVNGAFRGLYVMIEQVDKTFLRDRFGNDSGNLYKPEGPGADLTYFEPDSLEKETNGKAADWSDIEEFIEELNDPAVDIATILDVDSFLPWLAVSVAICNLDSYLARPHNYYLYNNPATGRFHFISWDHNSTFGSDVVPGVDSSNIHAYPVEVPSRAGTPLVERVLAVPAYRERYEALIDQLAHHSLGAHRVVPMHDAMRPWALMERYPSTLLHDVRDFDRNVESLVIVTATNPEIPGLLDFMDKRRAYLQDR